MDRCEVPSKIASGRGGGDMSSDIPKNDYEVFLSFRGPDTRQGFTDCLYHALIDAGIVVFRDDDALALGDKIDGILTALNNSKICIVVFSPTFAASAWCLREVERMVNMKKHIVPVFYRVTPDDVKLKTKRYAKALTKHETKYGKEQVGQWSKALKEIPAIKGRELKITGYIEFSRQIAKEIMTKLKVKHKYEIKNLVQVPDEKVAMKLLDIGSGGRRFVGIHGMGGIGKTTLAKTIFNKISDTFDCSCFLERIRDCSSQAPDGLHQLQERLLKSMDSSMRDNSHIVDPMKMIQEKFQRKKVIIVLDDVDKQSHVDNLVGDSNWFGIGSRIIFTTRNAQLHEQGASSDVLYYSLEKKEMAPKQALKLFSRYAFGEDYPPKDLESLSIEAITTMGGLPLAIELVGSFLHRKKAKVWRDVINKLKEAPYKDVKVMLKISYDCLEATQQAIFLDIACFFIGEEKANAMYMWEACDFYPYEGIEVLISMSLIKMDKDKCFWMHDQLRDFGRAIVSANSEDARAGSRLWVQNDGLDLMRRTNEEKKKVEALHLDGPSCYLDRGNFVGLDNLRFLRLIKCSNFGGDFGGLFPKLRWLSLSLLDASDFFGVTNLWLRKLVVLELSNCSFDESWHGWGQILISKQLKVLTLSNCHELNSTPDLSKIVNLERLVLHRCGKLTAIHNSVGKLQCLRWLSITRCKSLHELPKSIRRLVSLTRLELERVVNLPSIIGELVKLKHLALRCCEKLRILPDSIGDLKSLITLDISYSGITELPTTIGQLANLESLCLHHCTELHSLPESFGNLESLQKLKCGSSVRSLPDSFRGLKNLEWLDIGSEYGGYRIRDLHALPSGLTWLNIRYVEKIQNLSNLVNLSVLLIYNNTVPAPSLVLEGIEKLIKLERLSIQCWGVKSLSMENWGALQHLKSLTLRCPELKFRLCQLPCSLESLNLDVKEWGRLPINVCSLKILKELNLCNFVIEKADLVQGLESLKDVEMNNCLLKFTDFSVLERLRKLCLKGCRSSSIGASLPRCVDDDDDLEEEEVSVIGSELQIELSKLNSLSELRLTGAADDDGLDDLHSDFEYFYFQTKKLECSKLRFATLKNLSKLELHCFSIHDGGFEVEGLESLADLMMKKCTIFDFPNDLMLTSLTHLSLQKCYFPDMVSLHIPQLDRLVILELYRCQDIVNIHGIGKLKSLTHLWICRCHSLRRIEDLSELNRLAEIKISSCCDFEGIDGADKLLSAGTLSKLFISDCRCESIHYLSSEDD